jgi:hypothetical protein
MNRFVLMLGVAVVLSMSAMPVPAAQSPQQAGMWEIKAQMSMGGAPVVEPMTTTQCVSAEDAKNPQTFLPTAGDANGCKVSNQRTEGNKTTFTLVCAGPPGFSGAGEIIYARDSYTGSMKMDLGGQEMTVTYSAKRTGDCTK